MEQDSVLGVFESASGGNLGMYINSMWKEERSAMAFPQARAIGLDILKGIFFLSNVRYGA